MSKILAIRGGAIGDFLLTLPALRLLKTGLADPHLEILGYESIARVALEHGFADGIRSIEHGPLASFFNPKAELDPELCAWFSSFNLIVSWLYDPDGFFCANLERAGAKTVLQGSHRVDESTGEPAAAQLAKPLEQIALYLEEPFVSLGIDRPAGDVIAIHPGSGSPAKNWGYENWVSTAKLIRAARPDSRFLVITGEAEAGTVAELLALLAAAEIPFDHLAERPLTEVARAIAACRLFLGHDSGISHLAGAAGTPSLLVFGPTDPRIWAPRNPLVEVLRNPSFSLASVTARQVGDAALAILT